MNSYIAYNHIWEDFMLGSGAGYDIRDFPLTDTAQEFCFFYHRVRTWTAQFSLTTAVPGDSTDIGNFAVTNNGADESGAYFSGQFKLADGNTPVSIAINSTCIFRAYQDVLQFGTDESKGWRPEMFIEFIKDATSGFGGIGNCVTRQESLYTQSALVVTFEGMDLPAGGKVFSKTVNMYTPPLPTVDLIGTVTFSPTEFWSFGGIYDTMTGKKKQ